MAVDPKTQTRRLARLVDAVALYGDENELGQKLGWKNGAFIRQMLRELRPISEKTVAQIEGLPGMAGWFQEEDAGPIVLSPEERALVLAFRQRLRSGNVVQMSAGKQRGAKIVTHLPGTEPKKAAPAVNKKAKKDAL